MAVTRRTSKPVANDLDVPAVKPATKRVSRVSVKALANPPPTTPAMPQVPCDLAIHFFSSASAFEIFLDEHHLMCPGIWLKLAKKSSGIPSITAAESVEVSLCFGWIDGQCRSFDENFWLGRYTPRRKKSMWSQINVKLVDKLEKEGRMREQGRKMVEEAKEDGRWDRAYARPKDVVIPKDFQDALLEEGNETARAFFEGLNKSQRYQVLFRIETASPKARDGRILALIESLAVGRVPGEKARTEPKKEDTVSRNKVIIRKKK